MDTFLEFDHLMEMDSAGIKSYTDADAMNERIREWLDTPEGTVADMPGWGHNLGALKHEPTSPALRIMAEMLIINKIRRDVQDISITGVSVEFQDIDLLLISLDHTYGTFSEVINL